MLDVVASVDELVDGAARRPAGKTEDSLSGSHFERVTIDGRQCLIKYLSVDDDWILRATGDLGIRQVELWRRGLFGRLPDCIDPALLGVAAWTLANGRLCGALLMCDVGDSLVPPGSSVVDLDRHRSFIRNMATLHAALIDEAEIADVFPLSHHYLFLTPAMAELEAARGTTGVPVEVAAGWARMSRAAPRVAGLLSALVANPAPLVDALSLTPQTVVHGDWKFGNLGTVGPRTVLLDWDRCGRGPATLDLAWYLAVNCDRLPESKEDTIEAYRAALEACGVDTGAWFEPQLALALLGGMVQLGWAKTAGNPAEIGWWEERALAAEPLLA